MLTKIDYKHFFLSSALALTLAGCGSSVSKVAPEQPSYAKVIEQYIYADQSIKTVQTLDKILAKYPNSQDAYFYRGWANIVKRDYNAALSDFDRALQLDPNMAKAYAYKGYVLAYKLEKYQEALAYFDRAMLSGVDTISVYKADELTQLHHAKSECLTKLHRYQEALESINLALKIPQPSNDMMIKNLLQRSLVYVEMNQYESAFTDLQTALQYPQNDYTPALLTELGKVELYRGNVDQAITYLTNAVELNGDPKSKSYAHTLYLTGFAKLLQGQKFESKHLIEEAFEIDMFDSQAPFVLGYIAHQSGNQSKARVMYKIAKGLDPAIIENRRNSLEKTDAPAIKKYYEKEIKTALLYIQ